MNKFAFVLPAFVLPVAALAQAPAPAPSLGERVRAERPQIQKLWDDLKFQEAYQRAQALLPTAPQPFDKTNNQTLVASCVRSIELGQAYRLAVESADAAGQWEKALEYAKAAKANAAECYGIVNDPFTKMEAGYAAARDKAKQAIDANLARGASLRGKADLNPLEKDELEEIDRVNKGIQVQYDDNAKWSKFFQTYLNAAKEETTAYDGLIAVMEKKLQGEADQVADYKAGKGDKLKWVEAVVSSPAYLEAQGDKAGKMRWLSRLAVIDPESKKVQHQIDILLGKASEAAPKHTVRKRK